jgi:hypothetical protein
MKGFIKSKKGLVLLATLVVAAAAAVGGYAYFTSTGHGTGSATVGTDSSWVVGQSGAAAGGPLYPDATIGTGSIETATYTVNNPGTGNQNLAQVEISVANADGSPWTSGTCSASDFSVGGAPVGTAYDDTDSAGTFTPGETKTDSVSIQMIDNGANQNDCRGLTVPLYYSAS